MSATTGQVAAWVATAGFIRMICFQVLLALGFPLGQSAWGGKHKKLPPSLRVASPFSDADGLPYVHLDCGCDRCGGGQAS